MAVGHDDPTCSGVIPLHLVLGTVAKVMCSAIHVTGRDLDETRRVSLPQSLMVHHMEQLLAGRVEVEHASGRSEVTARVQLDRAAAAQLVAGYRDHFSSFDADWDAEVDRLANVGTIARTARHVGDQGSIILPTDDRTLGFVPTEVPSALPDAATQPWPLGDAPTEAPHSRVVRNRMDKAVDLAFGHGAYTAAVVVCHRGQIVAERYRDGFGVDTQLESWSMGKSLTATMVGVLVQQGLLELDQPAPIEAWRAPGDPRGEITIRHLLQMSGGLDFSGQDDLRRDWVHGVPDHLYLYSEALDAFTFVTDRPAVDPPGTAGRYRNCDTLALGSIVRRVVTDQLDSDPLTWPQQALFDRVGIRKQVLETDWHGNFLSTGFDYGTARNWARLGLLYLNDGVFAGDRVLPEWWSDFVSRPAPGWPLPVYGGQFWLNTQRDHQLPADAYLMAGFGGQHVFVVPSLELVVVRMGHRSITTRGKDATNAFLKELVAVLPA